jgi:hypothetical protein
MILVPEDKLLKHVGEPHPDSQKGVKSLGKAVDRMINDDAMCDVFTEAAHIVGDCYTLDSEAFGSYVDKLRDEVLADQFEAIQRVVSQKREEEKLNENQALLLAHHVFRDLITCYMNRENGNRLKIWNNLLTVYEAGHFPCSISVPVTDKEWFDEELVEECKILVY